jgi:hypothetical protein
MIYKIKSGKHRSWPPRLGLFFNKKSMTRRVVLDMNCRYYNLGDDTNKLFGIGYFPNHHKESARFGWRYSEEQSMFVISAYAYVSGERMIVDIAPIHYGRPYVMTLDILPQTYEFRVIDVEAGKQLGAVQIHHTNKKKWGFPLGFYFGGNATTPHDMKVKMSKQ